jgi:hypothetical protein
MILATDSRLALRLGDVLFVMIGILCGSYSSTEGSVELMTHFVFGPPPASGPTHAYQLPAMENGLQTRAFSLGSSR